MWAAYQTPQPMVLLQLSGGGGSADRGPEPPRSPREQPERGAAAGEGETATPAAGL